MNSAPDEQPSSPTQRNLATAIGRVAAAMAQQMSTGELAELRRFQLDGISPTFFRCLVNYVEPAWPLPGSEAARNEAERRWAAILSGMARLPHRKGASFGRVAAKSGLSELRFLRLLRDRGQTLAATLRGVVHFLASRGDAVDWLDLAKLVLSEGQDWGEAVRRSLARDYYRQTKQLEA